MFSDFHTLQVNIGSQIIQLQIFKHCFPATDRYLPLGLIVRKFHVTVARQILYRNIRGGQNKGSFPIFLYITADRDCLIFSYYLQTLRQILVHLNFPFHCFSLAIDRDGNRYFRLTFQ